MSSAAVQYCARCGRPLPEGRVRYLISIAVTADFDGTLLESGPGDLELAGILEEVEGKSEEELMNEVVQKLSFIVCKPCRDDWTRAPLGTAAAGGGAGDVN